MTEKQRAVLAFVDPHRWTNLTEILKATGFGYLETLRLLWLLEEKAYVERKDRDAFRVTEKGRPVRIRARSLPIRKPKTPTRLKVKTFSERYPDTDGQRYGGLFLVVRVLCCWLDAEGYRGVGHDRCGFGVQGGHTAHHVGHLDAEGLVPGCGAAHDLYAGLGSRETVEAFRAWLDERGITLEKIGAIYVAKAREIRETGKYGDADLAL